MIEIAGNILEGGGQILRNATALSCVLQKPIRITKIRAGRSKPGLRAQHLAGIQLLGELSKADLTGDSVSSETITFSPSETIMGGELNKDVGTAGSLVLLLQSALPVALFAKSTTTLQLYGGTNAEMAPPIDYFQSVFLPVAKRMGFSCECQLNKRGFYPKGGGLVSVNISPVQFLHEIVLVDRGNVKNIKGLAFVAGQLPIKIAQRMATTATQQIAAELGHSIPISIDVRQMASDEAVATGTGIFIYAETTTGCVFGGTGVGRKGKSAEQVAKEAVDELLQAISSLGCVDEHLQDQLIIFMALAKGKSAVRTGPITMHTKTAMYIAEQLTGITIEVTPQEQGTHIIQCQGIGYHNPSVL